MTKTMLVVETDITTENHMHSTAIFAAFNFNSIDQKEPKQFILKITKCLSCFVFCFCKPIIWLLLPMVVAVLMPSFAVVIMIVWLFFFVWVSVCWPPIFSCHDQHMHLHT